MDRTSINQRNSRLERVAEAVAIELAQKIWDTLAFPNESRPNARYIVTLSIHTLVASALIDAVARQQEDDDQILADMQQDSLAFRLGVIAGAAADREFFLDRICSTVGEDDGPPYPLAAAYRTASANIGPLNPDSVINPFTQVVTFDSADVNGDKTVVTVLHLTDCSRCGYPTHNAHCEDGVCPDGEPHERRPLTPEEVEQKAIEEFGGG